MGKAAFALFACFPLLFGLGCASRVTSPNLSNLYTDLASHRDPHRNPIIVVPGFLGSRLVDRASGETVWGAFGLEASDPSTPRGARLVALPMDADRPLSALTDGVEADGALDRVVLRFLGFPVELNAYYNILRALGVGGYRDEDLGTAGAVEYGEGHFTCFQFDYDWRRDIVESARALGRFIEEKGRYVAEETRKRYGIEGYQPKFDIVAHSMGSLVVRYYLRYGGADLPALGAQPVPTWAGAQRVERVVMVGPPNAGAVEVVEDLVMGSQPATLFPFYPAAVLGTMPSLYELLPRGRHGPLVGSDGRTVDDLFDPALWRENRWGLADPDQAGVLARLLPEVPDPAERRRMALAHQGRLLDRARRFTRALDVPARRPSGLDLYLVAGDAEPTPRVLAWDGDRLSTSQTGPGDGTVLRSSALMDERSVSQRTSRLVSPVDWSHTLFLAADHREITMIPEFTDNLLYFLLESPQREDPVHRRQKAGR